MYRIKEAAKAIYGWDRPILTFIYPGFDCGSVIECIFYCLLRVDSLAKCNMYPKSTPEMRTCPLWSVTMNDRGHGKKVPKLFVCHNGPNPKAQVQEHRK